MPISSPLLALFRLLFAQRLISDDLHRQFQCGRVVAAVIFQPSGDL